MADRLSGVRIVLVEPAGPLNVGAIARIMKNMGLQRLVLVNPQCDPLGDEARLMAVRAADVLENAIRVATLPEALVGCQRAIATAGRDRIALNITLEHPRAALPWLVSQDDIGEQQPGALIFGREDCGLTNEELNYAHRFVYIPSSADYLSLNLAQAVAICCYELHDYVLAFEAGGEAIAPQSVEITGASVPLEMPSDLAPLDRIEGYYQQLEAVLLKIGFLYPHTAASRMEKLRRLFNRAYLSDPEVAMLRGILSQIEWALGKKSEG